MRESDIEDYLVDRVKALGGEIRKVKWVGQDAAPDRVVMLRAERGAHRTIWVELKPPGKKATFPSNAHERAQHREHERMRAVGQRVEVVDSFEGVDACLS